MLIIGTKQFFKGRDEYCIRVTSSSSNCRSNTWSGNPITLFHNDVEKATIPNGFNHFEYCLDNDEVDVKKDKFKLLSGGIDGVSIIKYHLGIDYTV